MLQPKKHKVFPTIMIRQQHCSVTKTCNACESVHTSQQICEKVLMKTVVKGSTDKGLFKKVLEDKTKVLFSHNKPLFESLI